MGTLPRIWCGMAALNMKLLIYTRQGVLFTSFRHFDWKIFIWTQLFILLNAPRCQTDIAAVLNAIAKLEFYNHSVVLVKHVIFLMPPMKVNVWNGYNISFHLLRLVVMWLHFMHKIFLFSFRLKRTVGIYDDYLNGLHYPLNLTSICGQYIKFVPGKSQELASCINGILSCNIKLCSIICRKNVPPLTFGI